MLQRFHVALVQRQLTARRPQTQSAERQSAAKRGQGLAKDGTLLTLELGQKPRKRRGIGLVDTAAGYGLVDQVLNVLAPERRQCAYGNIEELEIIGNL